MVAASEVLLAEFTFLVLEERLVRGQRPVPLSERVAEGLDRFQEKFGRPATLVLTREPQVEPVPAAPADAAGLALRQYDGVRPGQLWLGAVLPPTAMPTVGRPSAMMAEPAPRATRARARRASPAATTAPPTVSVPAAVEPVATEPVAIEPAAAALAPVTPARRRPRTTRPAPAAAPSSAAPSVSAAPPVAATPARRRLPKATSPAPETPAPAAPAAEVPPAPPPAPTRPRSARGQRQTDGGPVLRLISSTPALPVVSEPGPTAPSSTPRRIRAVGGGQLALW